MNHCHCVHWYDHHPSHPLTRQTNTGVWCSCKHGDYFPPDNRPSSPQTFCFTPPTPTETVLFLFVHICFSSFFLSFAPSPTAADLVVVVVVTMTMPSHTDVAAVTLVVTMVTRRSCAQQWRCWTRTAPDCVTSRCWWERSWSRRTDRVRQPCDACPPPHRWGWDVRRVADRHNSRWMRRTLFSPSPYHSLSVDEWRLRVQWTTSFDADQACVEHWSSFRLQVWIWSHLNRT